MKKILILALILSFLLLIVFSLPQKSSAKEYPIELNAKSAILMDATTGAVLFEQNADAALPPASVTKVMTLLLVMEAIDAGRISLDDKVSVSEAASKMGGSQVYLEPGETMSVEELIKCVVIASANDAAYALAEHISGSEEAFVRRMNERAAELEMKNTHFENTNGLDDTVTAHLTSARDIAIMSRELLTHKKILEYTTIWQDSIRDGSFVLTNTNRLVRFYPGATGLKTGSTSRALFCISATAERNGLHLIAVVMGSPTRDIRNAETKKLLDYGFSGYATFHAPEEELLQLPVSGGTAEKVGVKLCEFSALLEKGKETRVTRTIVLPERLSAPIRCGDVLGYAEYSVDGESIGRADILAREEVRGVGFFDIVFRMLCHMLGAFKK
ncbi:MAG: D-alanyl-D-alanine carboxypeptidase [Clostridia bacterium]|nr:D-alanyl-D-alanine carboxypeptidase [Clostridia bacterium]